MIILFGTEKVNNILLQEFKMVDWKCGGGVGVRNQVNIITRFLELFDPLNLIKSITSVKLKFLKSYHC